MLILDLIGRYVVYKVAPLVVEKYGASSGSSVTNTTAKFEVYTLRVPESFSDFQEAERNSTRYLQPNDNFRNPMISFK